jgi:hypothetical protein
MTLLADILPEGQSVMQRSNELSRVFLFLNGRFDVWEELHL